MAGMREIAACASDQGPRAKPTKTQKPPEGGFLNGALERQEAPNSNDLRKLDFVRFSGGLSVLAGESRNSSGVPRGQARVYLSPIDPQAAQGFV